MNGQAVTAEEMDAMLNKAFQEFDTDNSGYIDCRELAALCDGLNTPLSDHESQSALNVLDKDDTGKIELFEFKNWWLGKIVFKDQGEGGLGNKLAKTAKNGKNRLLQAKLARKQAEADAQLLANRIALLQQEEAKAWKKIQQTKQRATEILETRENHERKIKHQREHTFQESEITRKAQETRFVQKQRDKAKRQKAQAEIVKMRQSEVKQIRAARRENEIEKQRQKQARQETNSFNVAVVRQHHKNVQQEKERKEREQDERNQRVYKSKVDQEDARTQQKEKEVQQMESQEFELIQRLQNAQMLQKEAYEQLEGALQAGPTSV